MVSGFLKSKRLRKVSVKLPSGKTVVHREQRNRKPTKCAVTKKALAGLKRMTNRQYKNQPLSQKRVARAYGGYLSASALKQKIIEEMVLGKK